MRYQTPEAHSTCCVLPSALITGSFKRKLVRIILENILSKVDSQQARGCLLEKYSEPKKQRIIGLLENTYFSEFLAMNKTKLSYVYWC